MRSHSASPHVCSDARRRADWGGSLEGGPPRKTALRMLRTLNLLARGTSATSWMVEERRVRERRSKSPKSPSSNTILNTATLALPPNRALVQAWTHMPQYTRAGRCHRNVAQSPALSGCAGARRSEMGGGSWEEGGVSISMPSGSKAMGTGPCEAGWCRRSLRLCLPCAGGGDDVGGGGRDVAGWGLGGRGAALGTRVSGQRRRACGLASTAGSIARRALRFEGAGVGKGAGMGAGGGGWGAGGEGGEGGGGGEGEGEAGGGEGLGGAGGGGAGVGVGPEWM